MADVTQTTEKSSLQALKKPEKIRTYHGTAALYAGAYPAKTNPPVVLFVPGLGQSAPFFFGKNDMYQKAHAAGYRTAFASFDMPETKAQNMWVNGEMLAQQIADLCDYYKTPRVTIVSHSKGGIDAQTAAVHFGAASRIERIITLSTPHWGSQLADIAYSSSGFALAELLKAHSPGCFAMQTGYMREYRNLTDTNPNNTVPIETFAGNGGDTEFTRTWAGSLLLDRFGPNDGVVTVESAHNPQGEHMGTLHLNHAQMGEGRFVFAYLDAVLLGAPLEETAAASAIPVSAPPAHIIRGGQLATGIDEGFYVDAAAESMSVCVSAAGDAIPGRFTLTSPGGEKSRLLSKNSTDGTAVLCSTVQKPQVGRWKLTAPRGHGAYCALIVLQGANICPICPKEAPPEKTGAELRVVRTYADGYDVVGEYSVKNGIELPEPHLENGLYNLEMTLRGELPDGSAFERTLIRPLTQGADLRGILENATQKKQPSPHKGRRRH